MIEKVLVANRGEIAVRIIRACRELGIKAIAVYARGDEESLHVRMADEAFCIGPPAPRDSYLHMQNIISTAVGAEVDAVHPGYGFLAENPTFADLCTQCGLIFIGPSAQAIEEMGNKERARQVMEKAGVPIVPGSPSSLEDAAVAGRIAEEVGYPVMLKAASGGGGKGMRLIRKAQEMHSSFGLTRNEAEQAFSDSRIYLEKFIEKPRHVEIQVLADNFGNVIHLGERDCSIQRRHQKLIEEAPCPVLDNGLRELMGQAAVRAARAVNYSGAGTVEFLLDEKGNYYFMEMNTRIQVEHPVTEMITGIDLVKAQLQIAAGEEMDLQQEDIVLRGAAIECRINAEDPAFNFLPRAGTIKEWLPPGGPGVRVDTFIYSGYKVVPHYDSLLAKIITWGDDREEARQRMIRALRETGLAGVPSTIELFLDILEKENFQEGHYDTGFLPELLTGKEA